MQITTMLTSPYSHSKQAMKPDKRSALPHATRLQSDSQRPAARAGRPWLLVATAVPVAAMLALHQLARLFHVPDDSPLVWIGAACAALAMAGAAALSQSRLDQPAEPRAGRTR